MVSWSVRNFLERNYDWKKRTILSHINIRICREGVCRYKKIRMGRGKEWNKIRGKGKDEDSVFAYSADGGGGRSAREGGSQFNYTSRTGIVGAELARGCCEKSRAWRRLLLLRLCCILYYIRFTMAIHEVATGQSRPAGSHLLQDL